MSKLLVIFKDNWADEMDVEKFEILTEECWNFKKLEIQATKFPQEIYVGSNQELEFDTPEECLSHFTVHKITDEEEQTIRKFFGKYDFQNIPFIEGAADDSFYEENGYCPD